MKQPNYFKEVLECPDCKFTDNGLTLVQCPKHKKMMREAAARSLER